MATSEGSTLVLANRAADFTITGQFTPATASTGQVLADATVASAWAVELAGRPVAGESWTIRVAGVDYAVTVASGDTRSGVARKLADAFNVSPPAGYVAAADATAVVIATLDGSAFAVTTAITRVATSATGDLAGAMTARAATVQSRALAGTPVAGEIWSAALTLDGVAATAQYVTRLLDADNNAATPRTLDSLAQAAAGLAAAINADTTPEAARFAAVADGARLVVANRDGTSFTTRFAITRVSSADVVATSATRHLVSIGAGLADGASATLVLITGSGATSINYLASGARTAAEVAAGLAALIDALPDYVASWSGTRVSVAQLAGSAFSIGNYTVTDAATTTTTTTTTTTLVAFSGNVVAGEAWTLTLAGNPHTLTLGAGFAAWINDNPDSIAALADYTALAEGSSLIIVKRAGGSFVTSTAVAAAGHLAITAPAVPVSVPTSSIVLSGTPAAGETWSIRIGAAEVGVLVDAVVDTLAEVAAALASTLRSSADFAGYTATARGANLLIVGKSGAAFTPTLAVTPVGALAAGSVPAVFQADLSGTAVTGDIWRVTLNGTAYSLTVGAFVDLGSGLVVVDSLDEITRALAKSISAGGNGFAATAEGNRLVIAGPAGAVIATSFTPLVASSATWGTAFTTVAASWASLTGTPVAGDVYSVNLSGLVLRHTVAAWEGRDALALALAQLINDSDDPRATGLAAIGDGSLLLVVKPSGGAFSPSYSLAAVVNPAVRAITAGSGALPTSNANTLNLSGSEVLGKTWGVTLTEAGITRTATYVVGLVDHDGNPSTSDLRLPTLSEIATLLADAINAQAQDGLTSLAVGARLVVVSHAGTAFTAGFAVLPDGVLAAACRFMANRHDRLNVNGMESIRYRRGIKLITH